MAIFGKGVYSYIYDGNAWTPSTASWSNNKDGWTHFMSHNDISYSKGVEQDPDHRYKFRITDALKLWKTGEYSQSKGIMLKAKNDETMSVLSKTFASYNRSELRPSLTVTYTVNEYYHAPFGWFDAVSSTAVSGWVWCVDDPNGQDKGPIEVTAEFYNMTTGLYEDPKVALANVPRPDVLEAGYGTGNYGFRIPVDWTTMSAGEYKVTVKTKDCYGTIRTLAQSPGYYSNHPRAVLLGIDYNQPGHDHTSSLEYASTVLPYFGYEYVDENYGTFTKQQVLNMLDNNSTHFFASRSHGNSYGANVNSTEIIVDTNGAFVSTADISIYDLSNLKLALFIACRTGDGGVGGNNLPTVAVRRGATVAIGFEGSIDCTYSNEWLEYFMIYMLSGFSVDDTCATIEEFYPECPVPVVCGDGNYKFQVSD